MLRTINQAYIHNIYDTPGAQRNPRLIYLEEATLSIYPQRKTDNHETDFRCSSIQVTKQYNADTASPAQKTTSASADGKLDKCLQFQVNRLNIG